jgi:hypothetical protein
VHNNGWDRGLNPKALQNTRLKSCLLVEVDEPALKWPFDLCTKERPITCKVGKKPAAGTRGARLERLEQGWKEACRNKGKVRKVPAGKKEVVHTEQHGVCSKWGCRLNSTTVTPSISVSPPISVTPSLHKPGLSSEMLLPQLDLEGAAAHEERVHLSFRGRCEAGVRQV